MKIIDAVGMPCPKPVLLAKKAIKDGETEFTIQVDNEYAVANLKGFAATHQYHATGTEKDGNFEVHFVATEEDALTVSSEQTQKKWAVFAGKDTMGDGERELGLSLVRMFFFTLTQSEEIPSTILFMNSGVKLVAEDTQVQEHLQVLQQKGVDILVCGTCLNFYHLTDPLPVGRVSNMYDILEKMTQSEKVVSL